MFDLSLRFLLQLELGVIMRKTFIISFEGGEAVGKSTQVKKFVEYLKVKGIKYIHLREPGGTKMGEKLREIYIDKSYEVDTTTEILLMSTMRSKLCHEVLLPLIEKNENLVIVLDRFYHSTFAYQHFGGGADLKMVKTLIKYSTAGIKPDLTILLDQPAEISHQRKVNEGKQDRFEMKGLDYYKTIENGYNTIAKKDKIIKKVKADQPIEKVHNDIIELFEKAYYKQKREV